jgi:hypothetical protein
MKKYSLNNIRSLRFNNGNISIEYIDGTNFCINNVGEIMFEIDLKNENDQPLVDHCI